MGPRRQDPILVLDLVAVHEVQRFRRVELGLGGVYDYACARCINPLHFNCDSSSFRDSEWTPSWISCDRASLRHETSTEERLRSLGINRCTIPRSKKTNEIELDLSLPKSPKSRLWVWYFAYHRRFPKSLPPRTKLIFDLSLLIFNCASLVFPPSLEREQVAPEPRKFV